MKPGDAYPENLQAILTEYGSMRIVNPHTGEITSVDEAALRCVESEDGEKKYRVLDMLAEMTVESAGVVLRDLAPKE